jgi:hypothetical protein
MEVHFFDNDPNYRYRGIGPRDTSKRSLIEVHFFNNKDNYRYRIIGTSKRSPYLGPLLRQRDQLQV